MDSDSDDGDFNPDDPDDPDDPEYSTSRKRQQSSSSSSSDSEPDEDSEDKTSKQKTSGEKKTEDGKKETVPIAVIVSTGRGGKLSANMSLLSSIQCQYCPKRFSDLSHLESHEENHKDNSELTCAKCEKCFPTISDLEKHEGKEHAKETWYCYECLCGFSTLKSWKNHKRNHCKKSKVSAKICFLCHGKFGNVTELENHLKICKLNSNNEDLNDASQSSNGKKVNKNDNTSKSDFEKKLKVKCSICKARMPDHKSLLNHMKTHQRNDEPPFRCKHCDDTFDEKGALICHNAFLHRKSGCHVVVQTVPKQPVCNICNETFESGGDLICHQVLRHKKR